jgi:hypothetical protein
MANQTFHAQARRICNLGDAEFWATADVPDDLRGPEAEWWATKRADHLRGAAFFSTVADFEEEMLAELRAIPLETEADRATMDAYVPLAQRMIELHREQAAAAAAGDRARISELFDNRLDLTHRIDATLGFECMVRLGA